MTRRDFAEEVMSVAGIDSPRLLEAFARVPREQFLGPGPWDILVLEEGGPAYRRTPDADPVHVNRNVVVALVTRTIRGIDTEVQLGPADGMPVECAVSLDNLRTVPQALLTYGARARLARPCLAGFGAGGGRADPA